MLSLSVRAHRRRAFFYAVIAAVLLVTCVRLPWSLSSFPDANSVASALSQLQVVAYRPRVLGYSRDQFGNGWAMRLSTDGDYLDTRDIVLRQAAVSARAEQTPTEATDGYTGSTELASTMEIDHIYPLAAAWDMGAWSWEAEQRRRFANDVDINLVATAGAINQDKSDSTPGQWLPPPAGGHCHYVSQFLTVALHYHLAISSADAQVARDVCGL